jgi:large-conductance mechanosensitive channel
LAIAVVIGAAFGAVVSAFVKDLLTLLIAAIGGKPDFSAFAFGVNGRSSSALMLFMGVPLYSTLISSHNSLRCRAGLLHLA